MIAVIGFELFFSLSSETHSFYSMGTFMSFYAKEKKMNDHFTDAAANIEQAVKEVDALISATDANSEIAVLNRDSQADVSDETLAIIERSLKLCALTDGAFDITAGVLTDLWDFDNESKNVPKQEEVLQALKTVGYDNVVIEGNHVTLKNGAKLNFGAVGKGVACDIAAEQMENSDLFQAVFSAGGSVCVGNKKEKVYVRNPLDENAGSDIGYFKLKNRCVSTSGSYERFFVVDNKTYHHILDLSVGYPVQSDLVSVSVVCDEGYVSDALATAFFVMGNTPNVQKICKVNDVTALFIYENKTIEIVNSTDTFKLTDKSYEQEII